MLMAASAVGGITITELADLQNTANLTTYTYSSVDIGAASADRLIVVIGSGYRNSTGFAAVNSVSVAGTSLTELHDLQDTPPGGSFQRLHFFMYYGLVTSGTSGDVVVGYNSTFSDNMTSVISITGLTSATPTDSSSSSSADNTTSKTVTDITIPTDGIGIFATSFRATTSLTATVTNATKLFDHKGLELNVLAYSTDAGTPSVQTSVANSTSRAFSASAAWS